MKKLIPVSLVAAVLVAISLLRPAPVQAAGEASQVAVPLGSRCVALLDPNGLLPPATGATGTQRVGVMQGGFTEGDLVRLDGEWVVLRDGSYENWIPRDKVLLIRASR